MWRQFVDWALIHEMGETYRPKEKVIRDVLGRILKVGDRQDMLVVLRDELSKEIAKLEEATRPYNARLIEAMANRLLALVRATDS